ncbi:MAG: head-tail connector protein [Synergistaceae bacterium]|jgi:uncharacterized phage protein (predicted DNA packaging)|nr:head-tail connector protein [Synergistaceae bacterium]
MTEPISLSEAKKHLRVEFGDDDELIQGLIAAAREYAEGFMNRSLVAKTEDEEAPAVKQTWKQAMFLLIGHWYEHRESVNMGNITTEIPMGVDMLLWQDRNVTFA